MKNLIMLSYPFYGVKVKYLEYNDIFWRNCWMGIYTQDLGWSSTAEWELLPLQAKYL